MHQAAIVWQSCTPGRWKGCKGGSEFKHYILQYVQKTAYNKKENHLQVILNAVGVITCTRWHWYPFYQIPFVWFPGKIFRFQSALLADCTTLRNVHKAGFKDVEYPETCGTSGNFPYTTQTYQACAYSCLLKNAYMPRHFYAHRIQTGPIYHFLEWTNV